MAGHHHARAGLPARAVAQGQQAAAAPGQHAGVAKPGRRRHARAALPPDLRGAAVGLFLHLRRRRAGGLPRPVPAAVADRAESRTETAAPGRALLADHDHGRPCRRPRPGRPQAPLHRPRRRPQAHAAQSLIPPSPSFNPEPHMIATKKILFASLLGLTLAASAATLLKTDPGKTTVSATFKQMNVPVESKFKTYAITIDYNAATPDASKASVEVDTASLDLGEPDMNKEVAKKEWFNSAQFPKASFVSTAIKSAGAGKLNVTGKLTVKGKTDGGKQVFDGVLPIKRLAFNIGEGEWKDTSMVADDVTIKFHVVAQ